MILLLKSSIFLKFILSLYSNQFQTLNLIVMITQGIMDSIFEKMENNLKTNNDTITDPKEDMKVLIRKVTYLLTTDNKFTRDIPLFDKEIIFHVNECEKLSYDDLVSIYLICGNINAYIHINVKVGFDIPNSSIKSLTEAISLYKEHNLKIVSVHIDYNIS